MIRIKKIAFILLGCVFLAGCTGKAISPVDNGPSDQVQAYIDATSQAKWENVLPLLSGEALQETLNAKGRVKTTEKIVKVQTTTKIQTKDYAVVNADIFKTSNYNNATYNDLASYQFKLQRSGNTWFIYKVSLGEYQKEDIKSGTLPNEASKKLREYIELPLANKKNCDYLYLAGPMLHNSQRNISIQSEIMTKTKVLEIIPLGGNETYIIAKAVYSVELDGYKPMILTAIADMVNISGEWKILQFDIAQTAKE